MLQCIACHEHCWVILYPVYLYMNYLSFYWKDVEFVIWNSLSVNWADVIFYFCPFEVHLSAGLIQGFFPHPTVLSKRSGRIAPLGGAASHQITQKKKKVRLLPSIQKLTGIIQRHILSLQYHTELAGVYTSVCILYLAKVKKKQKKPFHFEFYLWL